MNETAKAIERPGTIAAAAILLIVFGVIGIILGVLIVVAAPLVTEVYGGKTAVTAAAIGAITIIFSFLEVIAGWLLWNLKRSGGILAIILSAVGLIISFIKIPNESADVYIAGIAISFSFLVLIVTLIALGWEKLR